MGKGKRKEKKKREFAPALYPVESYTFPTAEEWQKLRARVRARWRKANPVIVKSIVGRYGAKNGG